MKISNIIQTLLKYLLDAVIDFIYRFGRKTTNAFYGSSKYINMILIPYTSTDWLITILCSLKINVNPKFLMGWNR